MPKVALGPVVALVLCFVCQSSAAQSRISSDHNSRMAKPDPDEVIRRQQWFRQGRQGIPGKSPAALRLDAYRQMIMRRKAITAAKSSAAQVAGTSSVFSGSWS